MDLVELVMAFEEAFDIVVTDACAERMLTVGDAHRAILDLLVAKGTPQSPHDVYVLLAKIVVEHTGAAPGKVVSEARFAEYLRID